MHLDALQLNASAIGCNLLLGEGGGGAELYAFTMVYAMVHANICEIVSCIHPLHSPYINTATK